MSRGVKKLRALRVLVDMDGVLCDFDTYTLQRYREECPDEPFVPLNERRSFYVADDYEKRFSLAAGDKLREMMRQPGYFLDLPEVEGAVDAVKSMSGLDGVEVFICTTAMHKSEYCIQEKLEWVKRHLGSDWADERMIITNDKTMINGDLLIDDKPIISGVVKPPSWEHVLFLQCHNGHIKTERSESTACQRLDNWTDGTWEQLVNEYRRKLG